MTNFPPDSWLRQHNARVSDRLAQQRIERFIENELGATRAQAERMMG